MNDKEYFTEADILRIEAAFRAAAEKPFSEGKMEAGFYRRNMKKAILEIRRLQAENRRWQREFNSLQKLATDLASKK